MADLDYAFLADYAAVEGGRLTAVGASFTRVLVPGLPADRNFSVALRARMPESVHGFDLRIAVTPPSGGWTLTANAWVEDPTSVPYDGKRALLAAAGFGMQLAELGLYTVTISIDGTEVRVLKFEAAAA